MSVLGFFGLGLAQLHPWSVYRLVVFEMLESALGYQPSLDVFRHTFRFVKKAGWYCIESRDKEQVLFIDMPGTLKSWRFFYFFVEAFFIPPERSCLLGWTSEVDPELMKIPKNSPPSVLAHYRRVRRCVIPFKMYSDGVLFRGGVCEVWKEGRVPVMTRVSTGEGYSLFSYLCLFLSYYILTPCFFSPFFL